MAVTGGVRPPDESAAVDSEQVAPGIIVDYNEQGQVVGLEMLHLSKRAPNLEPGRLLFEMVPETRLPAEAAR